MHESILGKKKTSGISMRFLVQPRDSHRSSVNIFFSLFTTIFYTAGHTKQENINRLIVLCFNMALGCRHTVEMTNEPWIHEYKHSL